MPDNRLGVIFDIAAQGTEEAAGKIKKLDEVTRSATQHFAEDMKRQGFSADEAAKAYKRLGISAAGTARDINAVYGAGASEKQQAQFQRALGANLASIERYHGRALAANERYNAQVVARARARQEKIKHLHARALGENEARNQRALAEQNQGIYQSLTGLRRFRSLFAATVGLASFGFWVTEWGNVSNYIANAASSFGGFTADLRETVALAGQWNDTMIGNLGKLRTSQYQALLGMHDAHARSVAEAKFRAEDAQDELATEQKRAKQFQDELNLIRNIKAAQREVAKYGAASAVTEGVTGRSGMRVVAANAGAAAAAMARLTALQDNAASRGIDVGQDVKALETRLQKEQITVHDAARAAMQAKLGLVTATEAQGRAEETAGRKAETAAHRGAAAAARAVREQQAWNRSIEATITHIARLNARNLRREGGTEADRQKLLAKYEPHGFWHDEAISDTLSQSILKEEAARSKLTAAQRMALPTEREIQVVMRQTAKLFPDLTRAEMQRDSADLARSPIIRGLISSEGQQLAVMQTVTRGSISYSIAVRNLARAQRDLTAAIREQATAQLGAQAVRERSSLADRAAAAATNSHTQAMAGNVAAILAATGARRAAAIFMTVYEAAVGFADLADFNFWGAAQAFTSSALYALAAGKSSPRGASYAGAAGASRAAAFHHGGGRGGRGGSGDYGAGSAQQLSPGGSFPAAPKNGNLTIAIMGETEAGAWLANTLNTAVMQGGAQLAATHTIAIPNPVV